MLKGTHPFWSGAVLLGTLALTACAQNEIATADEQPTAAVEQQPNAMASEASEPEPPVLEDEPKVEAPDYSTLNPVPIAFEPLSVKLRDGDKQIFEDIKDRILAAERITVRGYCDRAQVENAKEVAIERGVVVRNELVRLGVDPKLIRIRYSTEVPGKHAVEFELHSGA